MGHIGACVGKPANAKFARHVVVVWRRMASRFFTLTSQTVTLLALRMSNLIYLQCPYHITSIHTHTLDLITRLMRTQAAYLHTRAFTLLHGHAGTPSRSHVHAGTPSRGRAGLPAQKPSVERQRHGVELC